MLPAPFIIISHLISLTRWLVALVLRTWLDRPTGEYNARVNRFLTRIGLVTSREFFKLLRKSIEIKQSSVQVLAKWENYAANELMMKREKSKRHVDVG